MRKIYYLNPISDKGTALWDDNYEKTTEAAEAEAILVRSAAMHEMEFSESLLAIARAGAGVNNIPLERCAEQGIVVFNTPGANANGVKELALCGMLLACRDIIGGIEWVKTLAGEEDAAKKVEKGKAQFAGQEILHKKLGVIGLGNIGGPLANVAVDLGMEVYGFDPYISVDAAWHLNSAIRHVKTIEEIFTQCDIITLHVPLLDGTREMINAESLAMMKDGVIVLNFARDRLVDDDAMEAALAAGKVKRYVTDFPNAKTAGMPGVIAIPHLGASTEESEDNCAVMAVKELRNYLENGNICHSVNFPDCDMGCCTKADRIAILHRNIPDTIRQFAAVLAAENGNISDMVTRSQGEFAYTMLDTDTPVSAEAVQRLNAIEGVIRIRVIR